MNYWQEYQRRRWMRPDAHLWRQPNQRLWLGPSYVEAKYSPDQPRVPAGSPDGGQWTDGSSDGIVLPEIVVTPDDGGDETGSLDFVQLAGDIPTGDSPEIPKEPPPTTRLRNILIRWLASRLGPYVWVAAEAGSWIYDHKAEINSYFDPPKTQQELQDAANSPADGYDIHHVVERNSKAKDGSEADLINAPENLVRIPRWKHWEINAWYLIPNEDFGWMTPRQYLRGKSWSERTRVGLDALRKVGVLQ